ncbi:MAG: hypothetical protein PHH49_02335 [Candidatus Omnitrophica bacterium]|nr:hypothetical protein [Candidatus Omnitrophota bacterium]MDD5487785.1 hypothetical protein [Candidatus Omnitrophota bacterium]
MNKNYLQSFIVAALVSVCVLSPGCSSTKYNFKSVLGINVADLEEAKRTGMEKTVPLSRADAFNKVRDILVSNDLVIYQADARNGYIVAMGFPGQINTTRVGIFFDNVSGSETKITLSSLSSMALATAGSIIFPAVTGQEQ